MVAPPQPVTADESVAEAARRFASSSHTHLPVVVDGTYVGTLASLDVMDALAAGEQTRVRDLMTAAEPVAPDAPLRPGLRTRRSWRGGGS